MPPLCSGWHIPGCCSVTIRPAPCYDMRFGIHNRYSLRPSASLDGLWSGVSTHRDDTDEETTSLSIRKSDETITTMTETVFAKIIRREIPADIVYEDELCLAFRDINPQAPVHILVIPRQPIARLADAGDEEQALLGHLLLTANKIAAEQGIGDAFRLVVNNGADAGQTVFHLHAHVLGGRAFNWPPG